MAMTNAQKKKVVDAALREHIPWSDDGEDTRTLAELRQEFEYRHLGGLVKSYQRAQAGLVLEDIDIGDV